MTSLSRANSSTSNPVVEDSRPGDAMGAYTREPISQDALPSVVDVPEFSEHDTINGEGLLRAQTASNESSGKKSFFELIFSAKMGSNPGTLADSPTMIDYGKKIKLSILRFLSVFSDKGDTHCETTAKSNIPIYDASRIKPSNMRFSTRYSGRGDLTGRPLISGTFLESAREIKLSLLRFLTTERRHVLTVELGLVLILITVVVSNLTCRALLDQAAKKDCKNQRDLAQIALWFAPLCYDSKLLSGICNYRMGNLPKAKRLLEQFLESEKNCSQAWDYHGLVSFKLGDYKSVVTDYNHVLQRPYELSARAYANRGEAENCLGQHSDAVRDFNMALAEAPNKISYLVARAQVYAASGNFSKALKDVNKAIQLDPKSGEAFLARANIYKTLGKWQLAFKDTTKAIDLNADYSYAYSLMGELYLQHNKSDQSLEYFNIAASLDHKNWTADEGRKRIISAKNKVAEHLGNDLRSQFNTKKNHDDKVALKYAMASPGLSGSQADDLSQKELGYNSADLLRIGYKQLQLGEIQKAIATLGQGVRKNPNDPVLRRYLAQALMQIGEAQLAEQQIKAIYQLGAQVPEDNLLLARAQKQLKEFRACIISYEKCLDNQKLRIEGTRGLVDAYVQINDIEQAKATVLNMMAKAESNQEKLALLSIMQTIPVQAVRGLKPDKFPTKDLDG